MRLAALVLASVLPAWSGCADLDTPFTCSDDSQCVSHGGPGRCEASHACSFPDPTCASGRGYGSLDGKGLAGLCTESVDLGGAVDLGASVNDGAMPMMLDVAHLAGAQASGTGALVFSAVPGDLQTSLSIDTTRLQIAGEPPPSGVVFEVEKEATSGADLAVLRVGSLSVSDGVVVTVTGSRALIVVSASDVDIAGLLDAHAVGSVPGPGGSAAGGGPGSGGAATDPGIGGGGAGYGTVGAAATSSESNVTPSAGGASYGDSAVSVLLGGSGGGANSSGDSGGAGGGIVQLTSASAVRVTGAGGINAGGGGAPGTTSTRSSGPGGGSGGTIVLQAPNVVISGTVATNGGGGRGDSHTSAAGPGQDGVLSAMPAYGSMGTHAQGGAGGAKGSAPGVGIEQFNCGDGNSFNCFDIGPGAGGAVGRISILYRNTYTPLGTTSPGEVVAKY